MNTDAQPSASANDASNQSATMVNVEFYCKISNARILSTILSTIHHPRQKSQHIYANVTISARGIGFVIEEAKSLQAHAALQKELFSEYNYHQKISTFKIDLTILLDCLTIFGNLNPSGPSLQLAHSRERGNPLFLM
jgi:cell cycle checkpoint protein